MSTLTLSLFNAFQAALDGKPLEAFRTRKVQALLVYLAVERSAASSQREKLMALLWPDMPQKSAQSNLRQVIYHLRQMVLDTKDEGEGGPVEFLLSDHQRVQINPDYPIQVDVTEFNSLLEKVYDHEHQDLLICPVCAGRLEDAVKLYRGEFLADFYLPDSNEFEEWAAVTREGLNRRALDVLETLAEVYMRRNDYLEARACAERQLEIDNLRESTYRQLMTIHALSGRRSEALAVYERCCRLLVEELGVAPTASTTALYEKILAGEVSVEEVPFAGVRGYELIEEIGSGRFGTVYRAVQTPIGREVAVKVIRPEYANHPEFIRRFEAEAQAIARLEHPHIAPLYDYWREPDRAFLVLHLFRGGSLETALGAEAWPLERVVALVEQIAPALDGAHRQGVIHSDLKPTNILLDEEGNAYLSDFGIAIDQGAVRRKGLGVQAEYLQYVSPEQILDDPITPRTDIYSLGLVLYEALAGEKPFKGTSKAELRRVQMGEGLPPLSGRVTEVPAQVDAVIQRATANDPQNRYANVLAFAADFRRAARDEHVDVEEVSDITSETGMKEVNPYKGLRPFREEDAGDFFGREVLVVQLLARLSASHFLAVVGPSGSGKSSAVNAGLIPALRAGALPGSEEWFMAQMAPGTHPLEALEQALLRVAVNPPPSLVEPMLKDERGLLRILRRILPGDKPRLLLVVDQFEELYILTGDPKRRDHFIDSLLAAITEPGSPLWVVVTLRADFYDRPLDYLPLGELLQEHSEVVLPLSVEELEQVVGRPAERVGVRLEPGLMAAIAADVSDQPGALPLLQYALTELYEARQDHTMTMKAYQAMGGVAGALGRRAESLFETLDGDAQAATRQVFLRLVTLGEGAEDTRRRVLRTELESLGGDGGWQAGQVGEQTVVNTGVLDVLDRVLDLFGRHRLLTFDRDPLTRKPTVEIAHEALLREWPRLRRWLEESRDDIRLQRRLGEAAAEWRGSNHDEGFLLRGGHLEQFTSWAGHSGVALTPDERAYLDASLEARDLRRVKEESRRQRELETAQQLAESESARAEEQARSARRFRRIAITLGMALGIAAILAIVAISFGRSATQSANIAATRQMEAQSNAQLAATREAQAVAQSIQRATAQAFAEEQRGLAVAEADARATTQAELAREQLDAEERADIARSRELASLARLNLDADPELSMLLALEGLRKSRTIEAENALRQALNTTRLESTLYGHRGEPYWMRVSPDGRTLASTSGRYGGGSKVWDIASGRQLFTLPGEDITYQMGGEQLVTIDTDENNVHIIQKIWSAETGEQIAQHAVPGVQISGTTKLFIFSPDLSQVMFGYEGGRVELWDAIRGEMLRSWQAHEADIRDVAFSPDGRWLATITIQELMVWDGRSGVELFPITAISCCGLSNSAVFSPDGRLLATSGETTGEAVIWDVEASIQAGEGQALFRLRGHTDIINAYAFSADGKRLVTGGDDGTARVWSMDDGQEIFTLSGHQELVRAVVFTPDGERLVSADRVGDIRIWDLTPSGRREVSTLSPGPLWNLDHSPEGDRFAAVGLDGRLRVWSADEEELLLDIQAHEGFGYDLRFSSDGRQIATSGGDNRTIVWDAETGDEIFSIQGHEEGYMGGFWPNYQALAYSPDGKRLATGGADGVIKLWDATSGDEIALSHPMSLTRGTAPAAVVSLAFSPDGHYLATAGDGEQALIYDSRNGELILVIDSDPNHMGGLSFSPDGSRLVVGHWYGELRVFDFSSTLARGEPVELYTIYPSKDFIFRTAFSPDGSYLVSAGRDSIPRVWDAASGEPLFELMGMSDTVGGVQFEPDGKYIRAASFDGTLRKYIVSTDDLVTLAYSRLTRWWRSQECQQYLNQAGCPEPQGAVIRVDYATSADEFIGTWQTENVLANTYLRFQEDGRLIVARALEGLDEAPLVEASFGMEGEILSIQDPLCGDQIGQYRLRLVEEPGHPLRLIVSSALDPCSPRVKELNGSYLRVAP